MNEADFRVRDAGPADLPGAARLGAALIRFHHDLDPARFAILGDDLEGGYEWFLGERVRDPDSVVLVAASPAGEIVGYAWGVISGRSWNDLLDRHGKLHDLIVAPARRGRGVGASLARAMIARLTGRGAPRIVLSTAFRNEPARRLFERLGFRPTMLEMTRDAPA